MYRRICSAALIMAMTATVAQANIMLESVKVMSECQQEVDTKGMVLVSIRKSGDSVKLSYRKSKQAKKARVKNKVFNKAKNDLDTCMKTKLGIN